MIKFLQSKTFQIITWTIAFIIVLLFAFRLGVFVGYKKAKFFCRWGENYHRNFSGPRRGFFREFFSDRKDFIESNGTFGQVIKIDGNSVVIKGKDDIEKIILVKDSTAILRFWEKVNLTELKIDDYIIAIGKPNDNGEIEAKLVRIMP